MKFSKGLKAILFLFLLLIGSLISWVCGIFVVYLLTPPLGIWLSVTLAIFLSGLELYGIAKFLFRISKELPFLRNYIPISYILTFIFGVAIVLILWIPIKVPELEPASVPYNIVSLSKGEQIAIYNIKPKKKLYDTPIIFIPGGPGGPVKNSAIDFLKRFVNLGYDVYTYDHYSSGRSSLINYDVSLLTINDEVRRLSEVIDKIGANRVYLIGHSYAGALLGRFSTIYPEQAAKIVMLDTSPLYSLSGGNMKYQKTYDPKLAEMLKVESSQKGENAISPSSLQLPQLSFRENIRVAIMNIWIDENKEPYIGNNEEWSFYTELLISTKSHPENTPQKKFTGLSSIAQLINDDMEASLDYSKALINSKTAPLLVVHPENGVVPWPIHKDYENFFDKVNFYPLENADHGVWERAEDADKLVQVINAFFQGIAKSEWFYPGFGDPFEK